METWPGGWIGVDFDGTLATSVVWDLAANTLPLGDPVPAMVDRIKTWLSQGIEVRILTARVGACYALNQHGVCDDDDFARMQSALIRLWCMENIGKALAVTATKDMNMIALWDDLAVCVEQNTGRVIGGLNGEA